MNQIATKRLNDLSVCLKGVNVFKVSLNNLSFIYCLLLKEECKEEEYSMSLCAVKIDTRTKEIDA